nr:hypothetical protein [Pantoea stewartii]
MMMFYGTQSYGRRCSSYPLTGWISEELNGTPSRACSEKAKAAVLEHMRPSGANTAVIAGGIMAKNNRYYQTAVHKNNTRDRFVRSVNPAVAERMRAILEELKRKEENRG